MPTVDGSYYDTGRAGDGLASVFDIAQPEEVSAVIVDDFGRLGEKMDDHPATVGDTTKREQRSTSRMDKTTDMRGVLLVEVMQVYDDADSRLADYLHSNGPAADGAHLSCWPRPQLLERGQIYWQRAIVAERSPASLRCPSPYYVGTSRRTG